MLLGLNHGLPNPLCHVISRSFVYLQVPTLQATLRSPRTAPKAIHGSFEDSLGFWGRRPGIESQQGGRHAAREFERLRDEGRTHLPGPCRGVYLSLSCDSGCPFTTHGVSWSVFRLCSRCWVHPSLQADARPAKPLVTWKRFRTGRDTENTVAERDPTVLLFLKNRMLL